MAQKKITLSDVNKKYLKLIVYLTLSNGLAYLAANYIAKDPALLAVLAPTINVIIYLLKQEIKDNEGYRKILTQ